MDATQGVIGGLIQDDGTCLVGYADMTGLLGRRFSGYPSAVVIGKKLKGEIIDSIESGPTDDYLRHYREINRELSDIAANAGQALNRAGIRTMIIDPTTADDSLDDRYYETLRLDFSHKMAATRAGLGWIGKTDLLVTERFGPRLRLATVLIDRRLEVPGKPVNESRCGNCNLCVEKCPASAATGMHWNTSIDRDEFFDPFKCRETCRRLSRERLHEEISLCGICVSVCPYGRE